MQARMQVVKIVDVMDWRAIGIKFTDYNKSVEMEWEMKDSENTSIQKELFSW